MHAYTLIGCSLRFEAVTKNTESHIISVRWRARYVPTVSIPYPDQLHRASNTSA